jgi:hypothetical protein
MDQVVAAQANTLMRIYRPVVQQTHTATEQQAEGGLAGGRTSTRSLLQGGCAYVKPGVVTTQRTLFNRERLWGLDRIDQTDLPLGGIYRFSSNATSNVGVYVIDTGVQVRATPDRL